MLGDHHHRGRRVASQIMLTDQASLVRTLCAEIHRWRAA
jgi:hypothetical protein